MSVIPLGAEIIPAGPGFSSVSSQNMKGGFRVKADHAARDAIDAAMLELGMWCLTLNDGVVWQLDELTPSWVAASVGGADPNDVLCLYFGGEQTLNHGGFWKPAQALGNFMFWDMWLSHDDVSSGYVVSDGFGGAHALLFDGYAGNIWNGSAALPFNSNGETVPTGQVFHASVGMGQDLFGTSIVVVHVNGVPVGYTPFTGTRTAPTQGGGTLTLFVGGPGDHSLFIGRLFQMRGYDQKNPLGATVTAPYTPPRSFPILNNISLDPADSPDFLLDCRVPCSIVPDLSQGYHGGDNAQPRIKHPGALGNWSVGYSYGMHTRQTSYPLPKWVKSTNNPFGVDSAPPTPLPLRGLVPAAVPSGAIVFDSFSREDQTYAWQQAPTLGSTEGGSAGVLSWQYLLVDSSPLSHQWGLFNGAARFLDGNNPRAVAYVDPASGGDLDVRVTRKVSAFTQGSISIAFRVQDANNFMWANFFWADATGGYLYISKIVAGVYTNIINTPQAKGSWTVLRVLTKGSSIKVYEDATQILSVTDGALLTAPGIGLINQANGDGPGDRNDGLRSWDNFTVFASP